MGGRVGKPVVQCMCVYTFSFWKLDAIPSMLFPKSLCPCGKTDKLANMGLKTLKSQGDSNVLYIILLYMSIMWIHSPMFWATIGVTSVSPT